MELKLGTRIQQKVGKAGKKKIGVIVGFGWTHFHEGTTFIKVHFEGYKMKYHLIHPEVIRENYEIIN